MSYIKRAILDNFGSNLKTKYRTNFVKDISNRYFLSPLWLKNVLYYKNH